MHRVAAFAALLLFAGAIAPAAEPLDLPEPPEEKKEWRASGELGELLTAMAEASAASREVFEPLTAEQLNWRPPNGTHTPRWNAEHMAATQLMFFSQIYAQLDPDRHEVVRINPEQMPDDYQPAHPDWGGEQEAAQMEAISDYVQGHAYLLEGLPLDEAAPGSRWTPRRLLKRMESHYDEHTANVKKKFELEGWPAE
ncbi:DinB family protein [Botrimarina sp.]|uniref:DinB family protein n=1 Tax=Botrimarina sp. TaxID=2795802 RepID=UPI0032EFE07B